MTRLPAGISITGELTSAEDITVLGHFEGQLIVDNNHVEIGASAVVRAKVVARAVTICGNLEGNVIATERVDVQPTAAVRGHLTTPSLSLLEGARFNGSVDPTRTEAAMRVARYRQKQESTV
ncbi:MAG: polymer-forming cytoskeletal protein [Vicinamibacterales bacterium]